MTLKENLKKVDALNDLELDGEQGYVVITEMLRSGARHLGLPGYLFILGLFLSAIGEGSAAEEISNEIPVSVTAQQGKAAICHMKLDAERLMDETAHVIAKNHSVIGKPFDAPEVITLVEEIKKLLADYYGIKHNEEYRLIFEQIPFQPYTERGDYLGYVINALKYHTAQ